MMKDLGKYPPSLIMHGAVGAIDTDRGICLPWYLCVGRAAAGRAKVGEIYQVPWRVRKNVMVALRLLD